MYIRGEFVELMSLANSKWMKFGSFQITKIVECEMGHYEKMYNSLPSNGVIRPLLALYLSEEFLLKLNMISNIGNDCSIRG